MWTKSIRGTLPNYAHPLTPNVAAWIMNEGSGNKIFDSINKQVGIFSGDVSWTTTKAGIGVNIGVSADRIQVSNMIWSTSQGAIEILFIPNWNHNDNITHYLFGTDDNATQIVKANNNDLYVYNNGSNRGSFTYSFQAGKLYHLFLNYPSNKLYINGIMEYDYTDGDLGSIGANLYLGDRNWGANNSLDGKILLFKTYNRNLTTSEITQLHINPYCWLAQPEDLASLYVSVGQEYSESVIIELQSKYNQLSAKEYQLLKILINKYNQFETFNLEEVIKKINQSEMRKRHS